MHNNPILAVETANSGPCPYLGRRRLNAVFAAVWMAAALFLGAGPAAARDIIGEVLEHVTWTNETLLDIARGEDLGLIELMAANPGVDPWLPGSNVHLILPTAHVLPDAPRKGLVINLAELRIYHFWGNGEIESFAIGVGRDGFTTPVGSTKITRKKEGPTWTPTAGTRRDNPELPAQVPPGPDNPLGEFALYLGWPTYLIHGTSKPWGVGRRVSRGCIRLYPEDIAWLFKNVDVGTPVTVVNQPIKLGWKDWDLFIEVHPSLTQLDQIEAEGNWTPEPIPDQTEAILAAAGQAALRIDWDAVDVALAERRGLPVQITRSPAASDFFSPISSLDEGILRSD